MKIRRICVAIGIILALMTSVAFASEGSCCRPSEEDIKRYKADGTWEQRVEYMKAIEDGRNTEDLIQRALSSEGAGASRALRALPTRWQGMQPVGDAAILAIRVEFADVKFSDSKNYSEAQLRAMVDGTDASAVFPSVFVDYNAQYSSLAGYYERASYGKLDLTCNGKVYTYTLSENRDHYEHHSTGEQELIDEVLAGLDEQIDYSDYDLDGNGTIDGLLINFAGENSGWGSTWWSHAYNYINGGAWDGVTAEDYLFLETYDCGDDQGHRTMIHETGHMMGLPDYYHATDSSKGLRASDMMNNNWGDHNGFSKWLLGWIEEEQIVKVNKQNAGESGLEVSLTPLSVIDPASDDKLIAVVAPEDTGSIYSEYFLVEYNQANTGNHGTTGMSGHRIFHVDAELDEYSYDFVNYNMYSQGHDLIHALRTEDHQGWLDEYYIGEDELTPASNDSSAFYGGRIMGYTGIMMTDFTEAYGEEPASLRIAFEQNPDVDGKISFEPDRNLITNRGEMTLKCDKELAVPGGCEDDTYFTEDAYYVDDKGNKHPVVIEFDYQNEPDTLKILDLTLGSEPLQPETEYELVIPESMFLTGVGVYSEECRVPVKTVKFPLIAKEFKFNTYSIGSSELFSIDEDRAGYIELSQSGEQWLAALRIYEDLEETVISDIPLEFPEEDASAWILVEEMQCVGCYDGNIALAVKYSCDYGEVKKTALYKLSPEGEVLSEELYIIGRHVDILPLGAGVKAIAGFDGAAGVVDENLQQDDAETELPDDLKTTVYTVDFKSAITEKKINEHAVFVEGFSLDEESYAAGSPWDKSIHVYDKNDKRIMNISAMQTDMAFIYSMIKKDGLIGVIHTKEASPESEASKNNSIYVSTFDKKGRHIETKRLIEHPKTDSYRSWSIKPAKWGFLVKGANNFGTVNFFIDEDFEMAELRSTATGVSAPVGNRLAFMEYGSQGMTTFITHPADMEPITGGEDAADKDPNSGENKTSNTGDDTNNIALWLLMLISICIAATIIYKRKKEN